MNLNTTSPLSLAVAMATVLISSNAYADLIQLGGEDLSGTGIGSVNTILTITSPANSTAETGTVSWDGSSDVIAGSTVKTGASQTQTRTLGEVGVTSASSLRIIFNASEPNNTADNGITLDGLTFTAYAADGTSVFSASTLGPINYASTPSGTGHAGFVFGLTDAQAADFVTAAAGMDFGSLRAGLAASASDATGGNETFFIVNGSTPVAAVPELGTYALLMAGLGAVGFVARRRQKT